MSNPFASSREKPFLKTTAPPNTAPPSRREESSPDRHRSASCRLQRCDLRVDESALRADDQRDRLAHVARTRLLRVRMRDERACSPCQRRQLVFDERSKEAARLDRWQQRVARLFQAEDGLIRRLSGERRGDFQ